jgi:hypothetical protein
MGGLGLSVWKVNSHIGTDDFPELEDLVKSFIKIKL